MGRGPLAATVGGPQVRRLLPGRIPLNFGLLRVARRKSEKRLEVQSCQKIGMDADSRSHSVAG